MLFLLFSLFISAKFPIQYLNDKSFEKIAEHRGRNEIWVILFESSKENNATTQKAGYNDLIHDRFINASKISMGLKFGILDTSRYPQIPKNYSINAIPSIQIFYENGQEQYMGKYDTKKIIKAAISHQANFVKNITAEWKMQFIGQPSIMLFDEKSNPPLVWKALAAHYYGTSLRVGFTNNDDLFFPFEIKKTPTILFSNGTHQISYKGKMNFRKLTDSIDKFFYKNLNEQQATSQQEKTNFHSPKEFRDLCIGSKSHCVVIKAEKASSELETVKKSYSSMKINWILGIDGFPYSFMKKKAAPYAWIYNPRRDAFIASEINELDKSLESVLNGNAKWENRNDLLNQDL